MTAVPASGASTGVVARAGRRLAAGLTLAAQFLRGPRRPTLAGLAAGGCFTGAGMTISLTTGLIVAGVSILVLDWRFSGGDEGT